MENLKKKALSKSSLPFDVMNRHSKVVLGCAWSTYMETRVKGTMILKRGNRFFKVITVRGTDHRYVFECVGIDSKQRQVFNYGMLGLLEAFDAAASIMKDPKDILLIDLDNRGKWKILTKDEVDRISRS